MRLCVSAVLLLVLAQTRRADLSPDHHSLDHGPNHGPDKGSKDCSKFSSPLSLKDKTPVLGRFHFLVGFTDHDLYRVILNDTSSFWFNVSETQTGLGLSQYNKIKGHCFMSRANATTSEDTAHVLMHNIVNDFQFINASGTSMILNINASSSNISSFIQKMHLVLKDFSPKMSVRSFYLMKYHNSDKHRPKHFLAESLQEQPGHAAVRPFGKGKRNQQM